MSLRPALGLLAFIAACTGTTPLGPDYPSEQRATGREPLVLTVDPATASGLGALRVYGRDGVLRRDLATAVALGADWQERRVSAAGKLLYAQPPVVSTRMSLFASGEAPGLSAPVGRTQVLLRARHRTLAVVRVVGLTAEGEPTFDATLDGAWDWFQLSPSGRYLFGDDGQTMAVVYDTLEARVVWSDALRVGVFASDDSAFFATGRDAEPSVVRQPLPAGTPSRHLLPAGTPGTGSVLLWPRAATRAGVVYSTLGDVSFGAFLWLLDPAGQWRPLDPALARFSEEELAGFEGDGRTAVYGRRASYGQTTAAPLGLFRVELATGVTEKLDGRLGVFAAGAMFGVDGAVVTRWTLDDPAPTTLATLRGLEGGWQRGLGEVSDDGSVLVADALWVMDRMPDTYPADGVVVLDRGVEQLHFSPGWGELDRSGRLYVHRPEGTMADPKRLQIADVEAAHVADFETAAAFTIIY
jgi:hypothetical protein